MKMKNRLSRNLSVVGEHIKALKAQAFDDCTGHHLGGMKNMVKIILRNGNEVPAVNFWNDQSMPEMDGIDVKDRNDLVILHQNFCGKVMLDDSAKNTLLIDHFEKVASSQGKRKDPVKPYLVARKIALRFYKINELKSTE